MPTKKLDTSLKKNTSFVKRVRASVTNDNIDSLLDGVRTLSLSKYLNELISALAESLQGLSSKADVKAAVLLVSALHQRFCSEGFTTMLADEIVTYVYSQAGAREKEYRRIKAAPGEQMDLALELQKSTKDSHFMCFVMELALSGVLIDVQTDDCSDLTRKMCEKSRTNTLCVFCLYLELGNNLVRVPVATRFVQSFARYLQNPPDDMPEQLVKPLLASLRRYCIKVAARATSLAEKVATSQKKSLDVAISSGHRSDKLENITKSSGLLLNHLRDFIFAYKETLYEGKDDQLDLESFERESSESISQPSVKVEIPSNPSVTIWTNPQDQKWYGDIPELGSLVPSEKLKEVDAVEGSSKGARFTELLIKLEESSSPSDVDKLVQKYWTKEFNTKASQARLQSEYMMLKDHYKMRNFARFLRINSSQLSGVITTLIGLLSSKMQSYIVGNRNLSMNYVLQFVELVKYKMVPVYAVFHVIKASITHISGNNGPDLLLVIFKSCKSLLMNDPEYSEHTQEMIAMLLEAQKAKYTSHTTKMMIQELLISVYPPKPVEEEQPTEKSSSSLSDDQVLFLMIKALMNMPHMSMAKIYSLVEQLQYTDIYQDVLDMFSSPEDINSSCITQLCSILSKATIFDRVPAGTATRVIDTLVEKITVGMETSNYQRKRTLLAQMHYMAELLNCGLVKFDVIISLAYRVLGFGYKSSFPKQGRYIEGDEPDNYTRVRVVCELLLKMSGKFFSIRRRGRHKKLVVLLHYLDCYIWTKKHPLPIEVSVPLQELRIKMRCPDAESSSYQEAISSFAEVVREMGVNDEEDEDDSESEESDESDDDETEEDSDDSSYEDSGESEESEDSRDSDTDTEEDYDSDANSEKQFDKLLNEEFSRVHIDAMRSSTASNSSTLAKPKLLLSKSTESPALPNTATSKESHKFTLLSRAGKNMYARELRIPATVGFARGFREKSEKEKQEKEAIKSIVLDSVRSMNSARK